jgi:hypothetical protein
MIHLAFRRKSTFILAFLVFTQSLLWAQKTNLQIGSQIPLNYSLGVEHEFGPKFSAAIHFGILTQPYDKAIMGILKSFGTDESLVNTIGDAFNIGYIVQTSLKFNFHKSYIGLVPSYYYLRANDAPADAIESYYGITLPFGIGSKKTYTIKSNLYNIGLLYGHRFTLKNPHMEIRLELEVVKTAASSSSLWNDSEKLDKISEKVDNKLNGYYMTYGYLPSLNIYWVYKLGR